MSNSFVTHLDNIRGNSNIWRDPASSPMASIWGLFWLLMASVLLLSVRNSIEVMDLGVVVRVVLGLYEVSVKSHTSIEPSDLDTSNTPGLVGLQFPPVSCVDAFGEVNKGKSQSSDVFQMLKFQSETESNIDPKKGDRTSDTDGRLWS
mmetsp:Transcript_49533/g.59661  ORF Transcript_49533/g.59661 Transcript_49533/m.59661 type:complete len:148 (-) Transcript_49533:94-537(-)